MCECGTKMRVPHVQMLIGIVRRDCFSSLSSSDMMILPLVVWFHRFHLCLHSTFAHWLLFLFFCKKVNVVNVWLNESSTCQMLIGIVRHDRFSSLSSSDMTILSFVVWLCRFHLCFCSTFSHWLFLFFVKSQCANVESKWEFRHTQKLIGIVRRDSVSSPSSSCMRIWLFVVWVCHFHLRLDSHSQIDVFAFV